MILRKQSLDFSGRGEVPVSLEFDMNKVFEAYVATLIKEMQLDIQGCKISCQREISLSDSRFGLRSSDDGDVVNGIIDLDIESEGSISFVIDTKYKILEAGENPLTSDIFQVLTYAEFRSRQTNKKFVPLLLYPKTSSSEPIAYVSKVAGWSWVTGFVDFDDSLKKSEEKAKLSIQEAIKMASLLHQREHRLGI
jgi:5-methylcytosine-specific restriction endonuclease McrBC regulatory subunit McrC